MNILNGIEICDLYLSQGDSKSYIEVKFGDNLLKFFQNDGERIPYVNDNFELICSYTKLKFVIWKINFPYDIIVVKINKNTDNNSAGETGGSEFPKLYINCRLFEFDFNGYHVYVQQRPGNDAQMKEHFNYYNDGLAVMSRSKLFKNFSVNNVYANKQNEYIIEYEILKYKGYIKGEIATINIRNKEVKILICKIKLNSNIGILYFLPSEILYKLQKAGILYEKELTNFTWEKESIPLPLLPYGLDNSYPYDSVSRNIYATLINKSIVLCTILNPFMLLRNYDTLRSRKQVPLNPLVGYNVLSLNENRRCDDKLSPLLGCQLKNLDLLTQRDDDKLKKAENQRYQNESYGEWESSSDGDDDSDEQGWDSLDFDQQFSINPDRAMGEDDYWENTDVSEYSDIEKEKNNVNQKENKCSYVFCGYSEEYLHLEKVSSNNNIDFYKTIIIRIMAANFIVNKPGIYTGFIDEEKLVLLCANDNREFVEELYKELRPNSQFQIIESHAGILAIEI